MNSKFYPAQAIYRTPSLGVRYSFLHNQIVSILLLFAIDRDAGKQYNYICRTMQFAYIPNYILAEKATGGKQT